MRWFARVIHPYLPPHCVTRFPAWMAKWTIYSGTSGFTVCSHSHSIHWRWSLIGLAFVVYWGILLFGYDTYVWSSSASSFWRNRSGIAYENSVLTVKICCWFRRVTSGGVVSAPYFLEHFGLIDPNGSNNTAKVDAVSSNVVSVLQAGAFFGALGSAPLSGKDPKLALSLRLDAAND